MSRALRYWLAVLPSFAAVALLAARAEWGQRSGVEVRLEVRPFDPMDPLSGRYLAVPLAIGQLDPGELPDGPELHGGESVWVVLEPGEPTWRVSAVLDRPPDDGRVALRGRVLTSYPTALWIDYGLERFFIPHNAHDPTQPPSVHQLVALVRIAPGGRGYLTDLLVDGQPFAAWNERRAR